MADKAATATEAVMDFTNVKDGGGIFNKKRQPEGDYKAQVTGVSDAKAKSDGVKQWVFTIKVGGGTYPYYCKHEENQYWKVRNLLVAAGLTVPKKKVKVNPNNVIGKWIAVTLEDDEYDGKKQSNVSATFSLSELDSDDLPDEDEDNEDGDDDDDATPASTDDDEDEDSADEFEDMDRAALTAALKARDDSFQAKKSQTDDDLRALLRADAPDAEEEEEEDEEPAPPPKKAKTKPKPAPKLADDDDDDLEEIDIDDT